MRSSPIPNPSSSCANPRHRLRPAMCEPRTDLHERTTMRTRQTRSGLALTELGLGTAQLGNLYRVTTDDEVAATVDAAWHSGIRYYDTAPHYGLGLSERRLGEHLRDRPRDEYTISTKAGRLLDPLPPAGTAAHSGLSDGFAVPHTHRRRWDFSADGIRRSIEDSLGRLG